MDRLKAIYTILVSLKDGEQIEDYQKLSKEEMIQTIKTMVNEGLVTLIKRKYYIDRSPDDVYRYNNIEITMKGLQYINDNSKLAKTIKMIKGVSDIIK